MSKSNVQTVNSGVSRWRLKREGLCRWLYIGLHRPPIPCSAFAPCYWRVTLRSLQRNLHRFHVIFTARRFTSAVYARYGPASVCLSVCLSQVGVLSKRLKKSSLFFTQGYSAYTLCWKGTRIIPKIKRFLLELCFKLWTEPIFFCFFLSPRHVDRRKYCQLSSTDDHRQFFTPNVRLCLQHLLA